MLARHSRKGCAIEGNSVMGRVNECLDGVALGVGACGNDFDFGIEAVEPGVVEVLKKLAQH